MKNLLKLTSSLFLLIALSSCSKTKNTIDEDYVLAYLTEKETTQPIVFKSRIRSLLIQSNDELIQGDNYYKKLFEEGYLNSAIRTDIPKPETTTRPLKVFITEKAKPYILKEFESGAAEVATLYFKATQIKDIRVHSDVKAEVDVVYKKQLTPFYNSKSKDISQSGKEYPKELVTKTIIFRKNAVSNIWECPTRIQF